MTNLEPPIREMATLRERERGREGGREGGRKGRGGGRERGGEGGRKRERELLLLYMC